MMLLLYINPTAIHSKHPSIHPFLPLFFKLFIVKAENIDKVERKAWIPMDSSLSFNHCDYFTVHSHLPLPHACFFFLSGVLQGKP